MTALSSDEICFLFGAPPCRTFSLARTVRPGPPVVSDRVYPEGFSAAIAADKKIPQGELEKVDVDNILATRMAAAVKVAMARGIGFMVEQPWPWKCEQVAAPLSAGLELPLGVRLLQALYSIKPTTTDRYAKLSVPNSQQASGFSEMFGLNLRGNVSAASLLNPGIMELCMQFFWSCSGTVDFDVSSIQANFNFRTQAHRDKANCGNSGMVTFGNFTGGRLRFWPFDNGADEDTQDFPPVLLDSRKLRFFDGRLLHGTEDFVGDSFFVVFFKIHHAEEANFDVQRKLVQAGFSVQGWQAWD